MDRMAGLSPAGHAVAPVPRPLWPALRQGAMPVAVACVVLALVAAVAGVAPADGLAAYAVPAGLRAAPAATLGLRPPVGPLPTLPWGATAVEEPPPSSTSSMAWPRPWAPLAPAAPAVAAAAASVPEETIPIDDSADGDPTVTSLVAAVGYCWVALASVGMRLAGSKRGDRVLSSPLGPDAADEDSSSVPTQPEAVAYDRCGTGDPADPLVIHMCSYYGRRRFPIGGVVGKTVDHLMNLHPAHQLGLIHIVCTALLWLVPALYPLFLANGLPNVLGFVLSGFSCVNPIALINQVFFYYIVTRNYVTQWTRTEFWQLYLGGTVGAAVVGMLQGMAYMGPTGGSAALMAAFAWRNPQHLITIWPFLNIQLPLRTVGIAVALLSVMLAVADGSAGATAFVGGAAFATLQWWLYRRSRHSGRNRR
eukprot:EG_transcript_11030